jgi:hypothetical protein
VPFTESIGSGVADRCAEGQDWRRAWERLGYARLSDYADECVGVSARSIRDLAHVGDALHRLPRLRAALHNGRLGWTKVRRLARVADTQNEARWIAYARSVTAQALSREVRAVDVGSVEAGAADADDEARSRLFEVACTPQVRARWLHARSMAQRVHGGRLSISGCAELIAAEVLSAIPLDPAIGHDAPADPDLETGAPSALAEAETNGCMSGDFPSRAEGSAPVLSDQPSPAAGDAPESSSLEAPRAEPFASSYFEELAAADAFELDRRLRELVSLEQRLDARLGARLERFTRYRAWSAPRDVCRRGERRWGRCWSTRSTPGAPETPGRAHLVRPTASSSGTAGAASCPAAARCATSTRTTSTSARRAAGMSPPIA